MRFAPSLIEARSTLSAFGKRATTILSDIVASGRNSGNKQHGVWRWFGLEENTYKISSILIVKLRLDTRLDSHSRRARNFTAPHASAAADALPNSLIHFDRLKQVDIDIDLFPYRHRTMSAPSLPEHRVQLGAQRKGGFRDAVSKETRKQFFSIRLWDAGEIVGNLLDGYEQLPSELKAEIPLRGIWYLVRNDDYGGRLTTTTMAGWVSLRLG